MILPVQFSGRRANCGVSARRITVWRRTANRDRERNTIRRAVDHSKQLISGSSNRWPRSLKRSQSIAGGVPNRIHACGNTGASCFRRASPENRDDSQFSQQISLRSLLRPNRWHMPEAPRTPTTGCKSANCESKDRTSAWPIASWPLVACLFTSVYRRDFLPRRDTGEQRLRAFQKDQTSGEVLPTATNMSSDKFKNSDGRRSGRTGKSEKNPPIPPVRHPIPFSGRRADCVGRRPVVRGIGVGSYHAYLVSQSRHRWLFGLEHG